MIVSFGPFEFIVRDEIIATELKLLTWKSPFIRYVIKFCASTFFFCLKQYINKEILAKKWKQPTLHLYIIMDNQRYANLVNRKWISMYETQLTIVLSKWCNASSLQWQFDHEICDYLIYICCFCNLTLSLSPFKHWIEFDNKR